MAAPATVVGTASLACTGLIVPFEQAPHSIVTEARLVMVLLSVFCVGLVQTTLTLEA